MNSKVAWLVTTVFQMDHRSHHIAGQEQGLGELTILPLAQTMYEQ